MTDTFKKIGASDTPMYGPPGVLVCGYPAGEQQAVIDLFEAEGLTRFPLIFVAAEEEPRSLGDLLSLKHLTGLGQPAGSRKALILSGFTENELRRLLAAFRTQGVSRPLLATLTPTSETWTVRFLLEELAREAAAMEKMRRNPGHPSGTRT